MDCCCSRASASACRVNTEPQNSEIVGLALRFAGSRGRLAGWRFPGASGLGGFGAYLLRVEHALALAPAPHRAGSERPMGISHSTADSKQGVVLAVTARGS